MAIKVGTISQGHCARGDKGRATGCSDRLGSRGDGGRVRAVG